MDVVLVPVVLEFFKHDAILLHAFHELVGPGTDRVQAKLVALLLGSLRRYHHPGAVSELRDQRRVGAFEHDVDRERIHHINVIDSGQLRLAERAGYGDMAFERELRRFGVEGLAVMKFDAGPQLDRDSLAVGRGGMGQRELWHNIETLVDIEQLVAKRSKDDAPDICPGERGIEHIRVFGQPYPQCCLSRRRPAGQCDVCGRGCGPARYFHGSPRNDHRRSGTPFEPLELSVAATAGAPTPGLRVNSDISLSSRGPGASCSFRPDIAGSSRQRWHAVACPFWSATSAGRSIRQRSIAWAQRG